MYLRTKALMVVNRFALWMLGILESVFLDEERREQARERREKIKDEIDKFMEEYS